MSGYRARRSLITSLTVAVPPPASMASPIACAIPAYSGMAQARSPHVRRLARTNRSSMDSTALTRFKLVPPSELMVARMASAVAGAPRTCSAASALLAAVSPAQRTHTSPKRRSAECFSR